MNLLTLLHNFKLFSNLSTFASTLNVLICIPIYLYSRWQHHVWHTMHHNMKTMIMKWPQITDIESIVSLNVHQRIVLWKKIKLFLK